MDPILLQQQLKNNNKDLMDICQDLKSWGNEMQKKEQKIYHEAKKPLGVKSKSAESDQKKENVNRKEKSEYSKAAKKKCTSYADWDKFDADKECEKVDEDSDSELTDEYDENMKEEALVEKGKGNRFVKNGNWDEAIKCYTKAIEYFAYDPIFYANRALCYLKNNDLLKAESDCSVSLKLDNTYVKAYQRRAAVRESLNKLEEAKLDLLRVLELEPKNVESKNNLEKLKDKIKLKPATEKPVEVQRPISKFAESRRQKKAMISSGSDCIIQEDSKQEVKDIDLKTPKIIWPSGDEVILVKAVNKPPHLRSKKPLKRIPIEEINSVKLESSHVIPEDTSDWPRTDVLSKTCKVKELRVIEHKDSEDPKAEERKPVDDEKSKNITTPIINKNIKNINNLDILFKGKGNDDPITEKLDIEDMVTPKTSVQFHLMWKRLKGCDKKRYEYLKHVNPQTIPELFKESLESQIFSEILLILAEYFIKERDQVYEYLLYLTKIKRFGALTMFFTLSDKNCLWKMFNHLKESEGKSKEDVDYLIKKYEL